MTTPSKKPGIKKEGAVKTADKPAKLETEMPLSEKDEFKQAEHKTNKSAKQGS